MRRIALMLMLWPAWAVAQDWQTADAAGIRAALEGRRVVYESGAWQEFRASGATLYNAGRDSWGYWRVTGGQYCSQWPPSDLWACYDVEVSPGQVRFIDGSGEVSLGRYAK